MEGSEKFSLNKTDLKKIGKGALIAMAGVLLTYLTKTISNVDFGDWTPAIVGIWSVLVNIANRYLSNYSN